MNYYVYYLSILQHLQGQMVLTSAYMNRFETVCVKCSSRIKTSRTMNETTVCCTIYNENRIFIYFHRLNCIIHANENTTIYCVLKGMELEKVLLDL